MIYQLLRKVLMFCAMVATVTVATADTNDTEREGGLTGTGIVGEITALGSIIVNGQRITFSPDMAVSRALVEKRADTLRPGEVVAVAVVPNQEGWAAEAISQVHPLIGPVTETGDGQFTVLGVNVLWPGMRPSAGEWVAVSGFWARDNVIATYVQPISARQTVGIQGSYRLAPEDNMPMVGSLRLDIDPLQHAEEGDVIRVFGTLVDGLLNVTDVHLGLFDKPVSLVLAEGYLTDVAPSGHYTVAGSGLSSYTDNSKSFMAEYRITVCGIDGRLWSPQELLEESMIARLGCFKQAN